MSSSNSKISPAQLYQFYRRNRTHDAKLDALYQMPVELQEDDNSSVDVSEADTDDASVARYFNAYRRESGAAPQAQSIAIDAIMRQIAIDSARDRLLSTHFNFSTDEAENSAVQTHSAPVGGVAKSVFELPGKMLDKVINSISKKRMILAPAMAMALLAVFIVPRLVSPPDVSMEASEQIASVTAVPASLLEQATETAGSINNHVKSMVGFTSGQSEVAARFQLGQTVAQVGLVVAGVLDVDVTPLTESLRSPSASIAASDINDQRARLSDAMVDGEPAAVISALIDLDAAQKVHDNGLYNWYLFGQVMESVHLSSEIALRDENMRPLNDSLLRLRQFEPVNLVSDSEPLNARISELQQLATSNEVTLIDARRIQGLAQSIRALAGQLQ